MCERVFEQTRHCANAFLCERVLCEHVLCERVLCERVFVRTRSCANSFFRTRHMPVQQHDATKSCDFRFRADVSMHSYIILLLGNQTRNCHIYIYIGRLIERPMSRPMQRPMPRQVQSAPSPAWNVVRPNSLTAASREAQSLTAAVNIYIYIYV